MGGSLLELVTNGGVENQWINEQPEITFFKKVYRRYVNFGSELIKIPMNNRVDFGLGASGRILPSGDLLHRLMVVIKLPELVTYFPRSKSMDIAQLINSTTFTDRTLADRLRFYCAESVQIQSILELIESMSKSYTQSESELMNILRNLDFPASLIQTPDEFVNCLYQKIIDSSNSYQLYYYLITIKEFLHTFSPLTNMPIRSVALNGYFIPNYISNPEVVQLLHWRLHAQSLDDYLNVDRGFFESARNMSEGYLTTLFNTNTECNRLNLFTDEYFDSVFYHLSSSYQIIINLINSIVHPSLLNFELDSNNNIYISTQSKKQFNLAINNLPLSPIVNSFVSVANARLLTFYNSIEERINHISINFHDKYYNPLRYIKDNLMKKLDLKYVIPNNSYFSFSLDDPIISDVSICLSSLEQLYVSIQNIILSEYESFYEEVFATQTSNVICADLLSLCQKVTKKPFSYFRSLIPSLKQTDFLSGINSDDMILFKKTECIHLIPRSHTDSVARFNLGRSLKSLRLIDVDMSDTDLDQIFTRLQSDTAEMYPTRSNCGRISSNLLTELYGCRNKFFLSYLTYVKYYDRIIGDPVGLLTVDERTQMDQCIQTKISNSIYQTFDLVQNSFCEQRNCVSFGKRSETVCQLDRAVRAKIQLYQQINQANFDADKIQQAMASYQIESAEFVDLVLSTRGLRTSAGEISDVLWNGMDYYLMVYYLRLEDIRHHETFKSYFCRTNNITIDYLNPTEFMFLMIYWRQMILDKNLDVKKVPLDMGICTTSDEFYFKAKSLVIQRILGTTDPIPLHTSDTLIDWLLYKNHMIDWVQTTIGSKLIELDVCKKELLSLKRSVQKILYRNNSEGRCAWIKKLGHFIMSEVSISADDQILDVHYSDWLESYYEVSKKSGQIYGYDKMIGNIPALTDYSTVPKPSRTLVIPLVFYFTKRVSSSLAIVSTMNATFSLDLKLRSLNELAYKEIFSEYINPVTGIVQTPQIEDIYLMGEYFYLETAERQRFVSNLLEYITDEIQTDLAVSLTDRNLNPIYEWCPFKKEVTLFTSGIKTVVEAPDRSKSSFLSKDQIGLSDLGNPDFLRRSDAELVWVTDRTGVPKLYNRPCALTSRLSRLTGNLYPDIINHKIHSKQFERRYYFGNPTELMIVLIRPLAHITPLLRPPDADYFDGEYQWSNYSLYSTSDLSKVRQTWDLFVADLHTKLSNPIDRTYGLHYLIDQLLHMHPDLRPYLELIKSKIDRNLFHPVDKRGIVCLREQIQTLGIPNASLLCRIIDQLIVVEMESNYRGVLEAARTKYVCSDSPIDPALLSELDQLIGRIGTNSVITEVKYLFFKNLLWQMDLDLDIPLPTQSYICRLLSDMQNQQLDQVRINMANYERLREPISAVNPLISGYLKFNDYVRNPISSDGTFWSAIQPYWNLNHTPSTGINTFCFGFKPLTEHHAGTANLSKIDEFIGTYNLHPLISTEYPAEMITFVQSLNLSRTMSGLTGKAWIYTSANMRG